MFIIISSKMAIFPLKCNEEWVSEWLLFNSNSAISWLEQVNFQWDDDEVHFVSDQHAYFFLIVLANWNNSPLIDMSPHTLSWFRASLCSFSLKLRA